MKVLLLDAVTTQVVAMVYSQSQILEKEVYLVERMDADHEPMQHLKAVYFIRPTKGNIETLCTEISRPRFSEYHVFFCSICPNELLQQLAAADEHEGGHTPRGAYESIVRLRHSVHKYLEDEFLMCRRVCETSRSRILCVG